MFSHLSVPKVNLFLLHPSLSTHSKSPFPISLIPVVNSCVHEFRVLPFLRLSGGHHSKTTPLFLYAEFFGMHIKILGLILQDFADRGEGVGVF